MTMNIGKLEQFHLGEKPVISLFHRWQNIDHSFEEIRTMLKKAKQKLSKKDIHLSKLETILEDQNVQGNELNLGRDINLSDENVALYLGEDSIISKNITVPVKNDLLVSDKPFFLPLIASHNAGSKNVIVLADDMVKLYTYDSGLREVNIETPSNLEEYVRNTKTYSEEEPTNVLELSEESYENSRLQLLKEVIEHAKADQEHIVLLASSHYIKHFNKLNDKVSKNVELHEFNIPTKEPQQIEEHISNYLSKNIKVSDLNKGKYTEHSNNFGKVMALLKKNQIANLSLSKPFLLYHLGSWKMINELIEFNGFLLRHPTSVDCFHSSENLFNYDSLGSSNFEWTDQYLQNDLEAQTMAKTLEKLWDDFQQNGLDKF